MIPYAIIKDYGIKMILRHNFIGPLYYNILLTHDIIKI